jgi:hypothetical protein
MDADASVCQVVCAGELSHPLTRHEPALSSRHVVLDAELPSLALSVCPPHRWGCPVIMKLDPDHIAWTCGWCGVVATSDDLGVRPA